MKETIIIVDYQKNKEICQEVLNPLCCYIRCSLYILSFFFRVYESYTQRKRKLKRGQEKQGVGVFIVSRED